MGKCVAAKYHGDAAVSPVHFNPSDFLDQKSGLDQDAVDVGN